MTGIELIAAERERQKSVEGWTPEHDDQHDKGELSDAGACYAMGWFTKNRCRLKIDVRRDFIWVLWPFRREWFKPGLDNRVGRIRELAKAGALIAAEIDRLQRLPR